VTCKKWTKRIPPSAQREADCRILVNLLDLLEERRPLSILENNLRALAVDALQLSIRERALYWRARAKVRYALEGDENTKFFHASATCRLRRNSIPSLNIDGVDTSDHSGKASILKNFFTELLGTVSRTTVGLNLESLYPDTPSLAAASVRLSPQTR
jgi:hypothetical protein